jgi:hypothetical protein
MAESKEPASPSPAPIDPMAKPQFDPWLQKLVDMVNGEESMSVNVTLFVRGQIVTGTLISATKYFTDYGVNVASTLAGMGLSGDKAIDLAADFEAHAKRTQEVGEQRRRTLGSDARFAHLRAFSVTDASGKRLLFDPPQESLLRIRLSSVDAFMLGGLPPPDGENTPPKRTITSY